MAEKKICSFCKTELRNPEITISKGSIKEGICEYCGKIFCGNHIYFANHDCEKVPKEKLAEEKKRLDSGRIILMIATIACVGATINLLTQPNTQVQAQASVITALATVIFASLFIKYDYLKSKFHSTES